MNELSYRNAYDYYQNILKSITYRSPQTSIEPWSHNEFFNRFKKGYVAIYFQDHNNKINTIYKPSLQGTPNNIYKWLDLYSKKKPVSVYYIFVNPDSQIKTKHFIEKILKNYKSDEIVFILHKSLKQSFLRNISQQKLNRIVRIFDEKTFYIEFPKHVYFPEFKIPGSSEVSNLVDFYKCDITQLPRITTLDTQAIWSGLLPYQLIVSILPSETSGITYKYRFCVPAENDMNTLQIPIDDEEEEEAEEIEGSYEKNKVESDSESSEEENEEETTE